MDGGDQCRQLLDLIPKERVWMAKDGGEGGGGGGGGGDGFGFAEERELELRLGPPGEEWKAAKGKREEQPVEPALSLAYFSVVSKTTTTNGCGGAKKGLLGAVESKKEVLPQLPRFLQSSSGLGRELSHKTNGKAEQQQQRPTLPPSLASAGNNAARANGSSTRIASTPVVGWPPVRSFRKNLASSSLKPLIELGNEGLEPSGKVEQGMKGLLVKINMDGIPIGRKVDLKACDSYEKLSLAVDELFQGLIASQRGPLASGAQKNVMEKHAITGLLDGSGEYTLVYEDDEGDRMLVGDVPWHMFVSTVKRLRVLKSSELSTLSLGAVSRKRTATEC